MASSKTPRVLIGEYLDASRTHTVKVKRQRIELVRTPELSEGQSRHQERVKNSPVRRSPKSPAVRSRSVEKSLERKLHRRSVADNKRRSFSSTETKETPRQMIEGFFREEHSTLPMLRHTRRTSQSGVSSSQPVLPLSRRSGIGQRGHVTELDIDTPRTLIRGFLQNPETTTVETPFQSQQSRSPLTKTPELHSSQATYHTPSPFKSTPTRASTNEISQSSHKHRTPKGRYNLTTVVSQYHGSEEDYVPASPSEFVVPSPFRSSPEADEDVYDRSLNNRTARLRGNYNINLPVDMVANMSRHLQQDRDYEGQEEDEDPIIDGNNTITNKSGKSPGMLSTSRRSNRSMTGHEKLRNISNRSHFDPNLDPDDVIAENQRSMSRHSLGTRSNRSHTDNDLDLDDVNTETVRSMSRRSHRNKSSRSHIDNDLDPDNEAETQRTTSLPSHGNRSSSSHIENDLVPDDVVAETQRSLSRHSHGNRSEIEYDLEKDDVTSDIIPETQRSRMESLVRDGDLSAKMDDRSPVVPHRGPVNDRNTVSSSFKIQTGRGEAEEEDDEEGSIYYAEKLAPIQHGHEFVHNLPDGTVNFSPTVVSTQKSVHEMTNMNHHNQSYNLNHEGSPGEIQAVTPSPRVSPDIPQGNRTLEHSASHAEPSLRNTPRSSSRPLSPNSNLSSRHSRASIATRNSSLRNNVSRMLNISSGSNITSPNDLVKSNRTLRNSSLKKFFNVTPRSASTPKPGTSDGRTGLERSVQLSSREVKSPDQDSPIVAGRIERRAVQADLVQTLPHTSMNFSPRVASTQADRDRSQQQMDQAPPMVTDEEEEMEQQEEGWEDEVEMEVENEAIDRQDARKSSVEKPQTQTVLMSRDNLPTKPKTVRKPRKKETYTIPSNIVKKHFTHYAGMKVSREAVEEVMKVSETYWDNLAADLEAYALHAGRKRINMEDFVLLFKRQGYITEKQSMSVLIEKYLPMEERRKLIPVARAGNRIEPK